MYDALGFHDIATEPIFEFLRKARQVEIALRFVERRANGLHVVADHFRHAYKLIELLSDNVLKLDAADRVHKRVGDCFVFVFHFR
jgi:hypothetical protein